MPDDEGKAAKKAKDKFSFQGRKKPAESTPTHKYNSVPLSYYRFKDTMRKLFSHKNFPDAVAVTAAVLSVSIAFPYLPVWLLIPLLVFTIIATMLSPLLGLMVLLFGTLPMFIYQVPLFAWIFTLFISMSLFLGYKHYRTITFIYVLIMLPFSFLGYFIEIPAFVLGILFIGFRRAAISAIVIVFLVSLFTGLTGVQNSGPIYYQVQHSSIINNTAAAALMTPTKPATTIADFGSGTASALGAFGSVKTIGYLATGFGAGLDAITSDLPLLMLQAAVWLLVVFSISNYIIKSRSPYKGAEASAFSVLIPVVYYTLAVTMHGSFSVYVLLSFLMTPIVIFVLELNNINIVRALDVMKQDFLGKFGEAFEELTSGAHETLDDVANYDETKAELKEAIIAPIEHREISGAYNVKPARGFLLFGPPGTGKTLIMRALSNEIRARFFYVKSSSILSPFQGEGSKLLSQIFTTAKKHAPAVLFFDEIDGIAGSRQLQESDSTRQLLSTLLSEMDGFQKTEGVVVVGSTNVPQLLDPSIMRPGRFDKIVYMALPDKKGREEIFRYYLGKLPLGNDIDYGKLAALSERYSGADIKNVCDEVARHVADYAVRQRKVLQIRMADVVQVLGKTKPSTSISQIEEYNVFKVDYERRTRPELTGEEYNKVTFEDIVGLADAKKALYEAVEMPVLHPSLLRKYEISAVKGILIFGPPGTGKTMLMKAVGAQIGGLHMHTLSGSEISKYGYEKALLTIKQTFDRARENSPSVIFVDEIDALLPSRDDTTELGAQMLSEFLQQMDGIKDLANVVVVGATNRPDKLDPALLRAGRFDKLIFMPPPSRADRAKLLQMSLGKAPKEADIDYNVLADMTSGYTGADIVNACRQAKLQALEKSVEDSKEDKIGMQDLIKLIKETRPSAPETVTGRYLSFMSRYGRA